MLGMRPPQAVPFEFQGLYRLGGGGQRENGLQWSQRKLGADPGPLRAPPPGSACAESLMSPGYPDLLAPSNATARARYALARRPSISTVHAPHWP